MTIDTTKLGEGSPELADVIEEAMAIKIHFEKKTRIREWPRILEKVHKTKIMLTIGEVLTIAQTVLAQQAKIERLEEERDNLQRQVYGLLQNETDRLAARQGERE